jgi:hypothetical protein
VVRAPVTVDAGDHAICRFRKESARLVAVDAEVALAAVKCYTIHHV